MNTGQKGLPIIKIGLFLLMIGIGLILLLVVTEDEITQVDLVEAKIHTIDSGPYRAVKYVVRSDGPQANAIYRSDNYGNSWQLMGSGLGMPINALGVNPTNDQVLYAGTAGGPMDTTNNLWRSDDGGVTWQQFPFGLPATPDLTRPAVTTLVTDPQFLGVLYVGTDGHGVYRVEDGLPGFKLVGGLSLYEAYVKQLILASDHQLYALTSEGLFVTQSDVWQSVKTPAKHLTTFAVAPTNPQAIYIGTPSTGLHRSLDGGQTWAKRNTGLEMIPGVALRITTISVDAQDENHVVVGTAYGIGQQFSPQGIYESYDGGQHWQLLADIDALATRLLLTDEGVRILTTAGFRDYPGKAITTVASSLVQPVSSAIPILIVMITVGLAGLLLFNHLQWAAINRQNSDYFYLGVTQ